MRDRLAAVVVAVPFGLGLLAAPTTADDVAFRFADRDITESSDFVVDGDLAYTTNDSGDSGRVFTVSLTTGETVGVTQWEDDPTDVEALAPAGPGEVWVGDIGDNQAKRRDVGVTRVPVGRGERTWSGTTYQLTYPDGPADAETLLCDPATGRLYVVTKEVFAGNVYAAPARLSAIGPNVMTRIGVAPGIATDGAFLPDGRHVVIRSYQGAVVYTWPALEQVGSFALPDQQQGEGIAVAADDTLWLSSEGVHSPVLHVRLPADVRRELDHSSASQSASPTPAPQPPGEPDVTSHETWPWLLGGLVMLGAVVVLVRSLRPR